MAQGYFLKSSFSPVRIIFPIALSILGLILHGLVSPRFELLPFILAHPLIYAVAMLSGFRGALISTAIWTLGLSYFYFPPLYTLKIQNMVEVAHLFIFFTSATVVSWIVAYARRKEMIQTEEIRKNLLLEKENKLKDEFVNTLSHDLRNPLNIARLGTEMIIKNSDDPMKVQRMAIRVMGSLKRIDGMVMDLLDSRRLSAGNPLNLKFEEIDLISLIQSVKEDFVMAYGERLQLRLPEEAHLFCSTHYLKRALENLLSNAVKYGDQVAPIDLGVSLPNPTEVDLWVHNQGPSLTQEEIAQIFRLYERLRPLSTDGWGIGLPLVKAIVDGHQGRLQVTSNPGEGTTFHMILPKNGHKDSLLA